MTVHIYVDADSCPVKEEVYRVAKRYALPVTLVAARWFRTPDQRGVTMRVVRESGDLDDADNWIVDVIEKNDIVVSDDIILASRCLEKGGRALTPRGRVFSESSIGEALSARQLMADLREAGVATGGPAPFQKTDRSNFLQSLDKLVNEALRKP